MARNGSGEFALLNPIAVANSVSNSASVNATMADVATALSDSINIDGTKAFEANQPMGGFKLTGLGSGSAATDSPTLAQVQSGIVSHATAVAGTADAIQVTFSPASTSWTLNERIRWTSGGANTVTNPTISKDGGSTSKTIKKGTSAALSAGDTGASGYECEAVYNGTDVILLNPAGTVSAASESAAGIVELATTAEAEAGTDTARAVTPAGVAAAVAALGGSPSGVVVPYAGGSAPTGWLFCYGQAISRTTYAALFTAISTTYGTGDGSTTFNVPDLRGRVVAGQDDMGGTSANRLTGASGGVDGDVLGGTGGAETHTLIIGEIPSHTHTVPSSSTDNATGSSTSAAKGPNALSTITSSSAGGGGAHNNVQPTIVLNYIIKT